MIGVLAKANVRNHDEIEFRVANGLDCPLHHSSWGSRFRAAFVLVLGDAKKDHTGDSQPFYFAAFFQHLIDRLLIDAGHRTDLHAVTFAGPNEHGINEPTRGETRFACHTAQRLGAAQAPGPLSWKCHASLLLEGSWAARGDLALS